MYHIVADDSFDMESVHKVQSQVDDEFPEIFQHFIHWEPGPINIPHAGILCANVLY